MAWQDWIRTVEIEPSLYAADFANLAEQIDVLLRTGARVFHFDVGDGHFVEPITFGPIVLQAIAPMIHALGGAIDCHLMVDNPTRQFPQIARAGGDSATFHYEAVDDVPGTIAAAREHGLEVGVAFNPETEPEDVAKVAGDADLVLCMSIHPGYGARSSGRTRSGASSDCVRCCRSRSTCRSTAASTTTTCAASSTRERR